VSANRNRTERVRRHYDRRAEDYDRLIALLERVLFGAGREWVCSRALGEVLEIARRRARESGIEADLRVGDAQHLPFPDASFDTVVATLALCTIPDEHRAVIEAARVLRPGGRLLLLEHVRSPLLPVRVLQGILNPLFVLLEKDHLLREPLRHVEGLGLVVERLERSKVGIVERLVARRP
jgi:SAM-dependent methyltransferase